MLGLFIYLGVYYIVYDAELEVQKMKYRNSMKGASLRKKALTKGVVSSTMGKTKRKKRKR